MSLALDPMLLEILACPQDKGPLYYFADEDLLYNPRLHQRYAIRDDIPVMLVEEAKHVSDEEHQRLMAKAEASGIHPTFDAGPSGPPPTGPSPTGPSPSEPLPTGPT